MYKISISQKDAKFIVKEDERKVICLIEDTKFIAYQYVNENTRLSIDHDDAKILIMPNRFVGIAVCDPADNWDEDLGKKIAFHKAKNKFNVSLFKHLDNYINLIDNRLMEAIAAINSLIKMNKKIKGRVTLPFYFMVVLLVQ